MPDIGACLGPERTDSLRLVVSIGRKRAPSQAGSNLASMDEGLCLMKSWNTRL